MKRILVLTAALVADVVCWSLLVCFLTGCTMAEIADESPKALLRDGFIAQLCEADDSCDDDFSLIEEVPVMGSKKNKKRKTK